MELSDIELEEFDALARERIIRCIMRDGKDGMPRHPNFSEPSVLLGVASRRPEMPEILPLTHLRRYTKPIVPSPYTNLTEDHSK